MRGKFIVLEGGDGTGKSTQLSRIQDVLLEKGIEAVTTQEPGDTSLGKKIRAILFEEIMDPEVELFLLLADRRHHIKHVIEPALARGKWVLCDRYRDSSMVYQAMARDQDAGWVYEWHIRAGIHLVEDITFLFQESMDITLQRRKARSVGTNRFDDLPLHFHRKVAESYLHLAKGNPHRYVILPKGETPECLTQRITDILMERFLGEKGSR